jgi:hypothetical protein
VVIRDPVVASGTLPRFLAVGDRSRLHTRAALQAVAITRAVPLKAGRGKLTSARPSGPR